MKVSLSIENDVELRAYIKDCIKGQVLAIVREEFLEIVKSELNRKVKSLTIPKFEAMVKESLTKACSDILYKEHKVYEWSNDFVKPYVEKLTTKALSKRDFKEIVDQLVKEKIRELIK